MKLADVYRLANADVICQTIDMKYASGPGKALDIIPASELQNEPTYALLKRLKRLRMCYEDPSCADDYHPSEIEAVSHKVLFKSDPRWKQAYRELKSILATREHIKRKP